MKAIFRASSIALTAILTVLCLIVAGSSALAADAAPATRPATRPVIDARTAGLIEQLGAKSFQSREDASAACARSRMA